MPGITVKPPLDPPPRSSAEFIQRPPVRIRHPGYIECNLLFTLASVDTMLAAEGAGYGVQYAVVHTACAIIADNRFDGWLSTSSHYSFADRITCNDGDVLPGADYYFHVPHNITPINTASSSSDTTSLTPYPVVPTFRLWRFPHDQIPRAWREAGAATRLAASEGDAHRRDGTCLLTGSALTISSAHVVPEAEKNWFVINEMERYCTVGQSGPAAVGGPENLLSLRQDLHLTWDRMKFSLLPKQHTDNSWRWVAHANVTNPDEVYTLYHNRQLRTITGGRHELLFARFAWDVFPTLRGFLSMGLPRWLKGYDRDVRSYSGLDCEKFCYNQGSLRSISPAKSSRSKRSREDEMGDMEDDLKVMTSIDSAIGGFANDGNYSDLDVKTWLREQQEFEENLEAEEREYVKNWLEEQKTMEEERTRGRKRTRLIRYRDHSSD